MTIEIGRFSEASGTSVNFPVDAAGKEQEPPELVYGSAEEFLHEQLLPTYVRSVDGRSAQWCIEWYFHPEAVSRIEALWRAWEHLRLDGATGMSVWWKDHADHHMNVLLDPRGPFHKCDMKAHRDPEHLEPKNAPEGWFPDVRTQPARNGVSVPATDASRRELIKRHEDGLSERLSVLNLHGMIRTAGAPADFPNDGAVVAWRHED